MSDTFHQHSSCTIFPYEEERTDAKLNGDSKEVELLAVQLRGDVGAFDVDVGRLDDASLAKESSRDQAVDELVPGFTSKGQYEVQCRRQVANKP